MADLSDAAHADAMRNAGWDPKPLRQSDQPNDYPVDRLPVSSGRLCGRSLTIRKRRWHWSLAALCQQCLR